MICRKFKPTLSSTKMLSLIYCWLTIACLNPMSVHANDDLPKAETILAEYVKATGGKAAYDKIENRVTKATLSLPAHNFEASSTRYAAKPNKVYTVAESDQIGKIEQGSDGKASWSIRPQTGSVLNEGKSHESYMTRASFDGLAYWKKNYSEIKCTGIEKFNGNDCYVLKMTPKTSDKTITLNPTTSFFDKKSGLLSKQNSTFVTPMGDVELEVIYSDYRKVDGIKLPFKIEQNTPGQELVITIDSIEHNVDLPKDRFDLPDEIKKLIEKDK